MNDYKFQSINEFRALLSLYGITVEEVKGEAKGKSYNGIVYSVIDKKGKKKGNPFKSSLISRNVGHKGLQKKYTASKFEMKDKSVYARTRDIVSAAMNKNLNKKDFQKELEKNGLSVIFRENDDKRIYGVTFIDHQDKAVFNGSKMGKEFSANTFNALYGNDKRNDNMIDNNKSFDFNNYQEEETTVSSVAGLFSMEQHGDDYNEIAFTNRMKRKNKRKGRGF